MARPVFQTKTNWWEKNLENEYKKTSSLDPKSLQFVLLKTTSDREKFRNYLQWRQKWNMKKERGRGMPDWGCSVGDSYFPALSCWFNGSSHANFHLKVKRSNEISGNQSSEIPFLGKMVSDEMLRQDLDEVLAEEKSVHQLAESQSCFPYFFNCWFFMFGGEQF